MLENVIRKGGDVSIESHGRDERADVQRRLKQSRAAGDEPRGFVSGRNNRRLGPVSVATGTKITDITGARSPQG